MVVVARDDDDLATRPESGREVPERRLGRRERIAHRPLAKLEHVAEQDQPLHPRQRLPQRRPELRAAEKIAFRTRPEVEVGDDQRAQLRLRAD